MVNELSRYSPREILINPDALEYKTLPPFIEEHLSASLELLEAAEYEAETCEPLVLEQFQKETLEALGLEQSPLVVRAIGALLCYLKRTQRTGLERMTEVELYSGAQFMRLDLNARRNLELLETMRNKEKRGSLLWVLDKTQTAMGKRLIRSVDRAAASQPGADQPPVECGGRALGGCDSARQPFGAAHRNLRFGAPDVADCVRLRQRPGAAVFGGGSSQAAGAEGSLEWMRNRRMLSGVYQDSWIRWRMCWS